MNEIPRRALFDKWWPAERAIHDAAQQVEAIGADTRLTDAVILLGAARDSVADYIDGVVRRRFVRMQDHEPCWLIESASPQGVPQYWDGHRNDCFTIDPNEAVRFARFEDAERVRGWMLSEPIRNHCRSVQHIFAAPVGV